MKVTDIRRGDIVTYRDGSKNHVNKPKRYKCWYYNDFTNKNKDSNKDIKKIQRYVKFLCFYRLKTIYKRVK